MIQCPRRSNSSESLTRPTLNRESSPESVAAPGRSVPPQPRPPRNQDTPGRAARPRPPPKSADSKPSTAPARPRQTSRVGRGWSPAHTPQPASVRRVPADNHGARPIPGLGLLTIFENRLASIEARTHRHVETPPLPMQRPSARGHVSAWAERLNDVERGQQKDNENPQDR